jgi:hypothetical protein
MSNDLSPSAVYIHAAVDPANPWQGIRDGLACLRSLSRCGLHLQAIIGFHLASLKKAHGISAGNPSRKAQAAPEKWADILKRETGLSRETGNRFIRLADAVVAKLKRIRPGAKQFTIIPRDRAIHILTTSPADLDPDLRDQLHDLIASVCDGETQASILREIGVLPGPRTMPESPGGRKNRDHIPAGEAAQLFFESILASAVNARSTSGYRDMLTALPPEGEGVTLASLESELRAILEDIAAIKSATLRPAKGRTIR